MTLKTYHFQWTEIVIDSDLPSYSKYLCLYLATFMNGKQNLAWPSLARIQKETGLTKPTIIKYLDIAESANFLVTERKDDYKTNNHYHARIPNSLLRVVKEVNQGSKGDLLGVVKDVNTNKQVNKQVNKKRVKKKTFTPPTVEEISLYAKTRNSTVDPKYFFDYFDSSGWKDSFGNKVKNWKQKFISWDNREKKNNPTKNVEHIATGRTV